MKKEKSSELGFVRLDDDWINSKTIRKVRVHAEDAKDKETKNAEKKRENPFNSLPFAKGKGRVGDGVEYN
ncbi:MAG: hypothetical protein K8S23_08330 [Candidatus Cloacimonetes bacterium]|nr:hypothetical protein [Candidatus Cloacimonadota bacterium]